MDNNPNQRTYFFTSERIKKERLDMGLTLKQLLSYLSDLFRSFGYSLKYDHKFNEYTIKNLSTNDSMNISEELLDKLKSEVLSFMRFKVTELFNGRFQDSP